MSHAPAIAFGLAGSKIAAMRPVRVGLIGDYRGSVVAHRAIPPSLQIAGSVLGRDIEETRLPTYRQWFEHSDVVVSGVDEAGEPRAIELRGHSFFIGTAYQPERSALTGHAHPLVVAFAEAMAAHS